MACTGMSIFSEDGRLSADGWNIEPPHPGLLRPLRSLGGEIDFKRSYEHRRKISDNNKSTSRVEWMLWDEGLG